MRSETCTRCGQEVRWGWRHGREGYWHREDVDHVAIFGRRMTAEDYEEIERQLDLPRIDANGDVYTTRAYDIAKIKDREKREAAEAEEEIDTATIPEPEVRSTRIEIGDPRLPGGAKQILKLAEKHGWTAWATYARGPRLHASLGTLLEVSDSVLVRMRLDGSNRRAVASWVTKNGKAGFEFAWLLEADFKTRKYVTTGANSDQLKAWIKNET